MRAKGKIWLLRHNHLQVNGAGKRRPLKNGSRESKRALSAGKPLAPEIPWQVLTEYLLSDTGTRKGESVAFVRFVASGSVSVVTVCVAPIPRPSEDGPATPG